MTSWTLSGRSISIGQYLIALVLVTAIYAAGRSILNLHRLVPTEAAELLWSFEFCIILVGWVYFDRRANEFSVPFEFDAFMFFAWVFVLPYYLFQTRGRRGLMLLVGIYGLTVIP